MLGIFPPTQKIEDWMKGKTELKYIIDIVTKLIWGYAIRHSKAKGWQMKYKSKFINVTQPSKMKNKLI